MQVAIRIDGAELKVFSPYDADFVKGAKELGGKWKPKNPSQRGKSYSHPDDHWLFLRTEIDAVQDLCIKVFGRDAVDYMITGRIVWKKDEEIAKFDEWPKILEPFSLSARLNANVTLIAGGIENGVMKQGSVVLIKYIYADYFGRRAKSHNDNPDSCRRYELGDLAAMQLADLKYEREQHLERVELLNARIAEAERDT